MPGCPVTTNMYLHVVTCGYTKFLGFIVLGANGDLGTVKLPITIRDLGVLGHQMARRGYKFIREDGSVVDGAGLGLFPTLWSPFERSPVWTGAIN